MDVAEKFLNNIPGCMLLGRFSSAQILQYVAPETLVRSAGLVAAIGLTIGLIVNSSVSVIIGFGLVGLGLSVMIPIAYSAVTNHPEIPRGRAIASVVTLGYSGFVFGPPILGWIAQETSLRLALFLVVGTTMAIVLMAPNVAKRR